nr:sigma-70 family RNA polymerase sigma factor [Actinomycetota bacterium]
MREARAEADRSFERLYELHRRDVYGAALRELGNVHDAEDVTQAAFVDAYRAILRGSRPESPRPWLLAIAENVRRRRFRTALHRPREEPLDIETAPAAEVPSEQADALRSALASLPQQQREVFLLREISGLSYEEIAEHAEASVGGVQMLLFRARQALRAQLDPPSVARRRTIMPQIPAWLAHLVGRGDTLALTPRGIGACAAVVLAVSGATAGVVESPGDTPQAAAAVLGQRPVLKRMPASKQARVRAFVVVAPGRSDTAPARSAPAAIRTPAAKPTRQAREAPAPANLPAQQEEAPAPATSSAPPAVAPAPPDVTSKLPAVTPAQPLVPPVMPVVPAPPVVSSEPPVVLPAQPVAPPVVL